MEGFIELKREREAAIVQQALIHSMNQLSCILLPTVIVLPDGMMANKSEVELHIRVCSLLRVKTLKVFWCSHIQCIFIHLLCQSELCTKAGLALKWSVFNFLLCSPSFTECIKYEEHLVSSENTGDITSQGKDTIPFWFSNLKFLLSASAN